MNKISIIIPLKDPDDSFNDLLESLKTQKEFIYELVIIDSSKERVLQKSILENLGINFKYISADNYPGESRNKGVEHMSGNIIAFLDSKTVPAHDWLKEGMNLLSNRRLKCIFGMTRYKASTSSQKIIRASIFGKSGVETLPGTIIYKDYFLECGLFVEGVRAGEDFEWRERFKEMYPKSWGVNDRSCLKYKSISATFFIEAKRQFIYQMHSALVDIQTSAKAFVLGISLFLFSLLIPRWNSLVGWESSAFYISDITKKYFYLMCMIFLILFFFKIFSNSTNRIISRFIASILFLFSIYFVFFWNARIAGWNMSSIFYVPHITKIYLFILLTISILYRGLIFPLKKGISHQYLFPLNWMRVGFIGFLLDLSKLPGYFIGGMLIYFNNFKKNNNLN